MVLSCNKLFPAPSRDCVESTSSRLPTPEQSFLTSWRKDGSLRRGLGSVSPGLVPVTEVGSHFWRGGHCPTAQPLEDRGPACRAPAVPLSRSCPGHWGSVACWQSLPAAHLDPRSWRPPAPLGLPWSPPWACPLAHCLLENLWPPLPPSPPAPITAQL